MLEYRLEPEGGLLVCALGTLEVGGGQIVECSLCLSDILPERRVALAVELLEERSRPLKAPVLGDMSCTIHESLSAVVRYRFWEGDRLLFDHTDSRSSFEYAAERSHSCRTD